MNWNYIIELRGLTKLILFYKMSICARARPAQKRPSNKPLANCHQCSLPKMQEPGSGSLSMLQNYRRHALAERQPKRRGTIMCLLLAFADCLGCRGYDGGMTKPTPSAEHATFPGLVARVFSVPREELQRREAEYRKASEARPLGPGPKRGSQRELII